MKPQQLPNEDLIERCKILRDMLTNDNHAQHLTELITRFERLIIGQQADEACKKAEELQQPTLETSRDFIISKDNPVKKVQVDDEVEALARELFLILFESINQPSHKDLPSDNVINHSFDLAEQFINHRNERRGKK